MEVKLCFVDCFLFFFFWEDGLWNTEYGFPGDTGWELSLTYEKSTKMSDTNENGWSNPLGTTQKQLAKQQFISSKWEFRSLYMLYSLCLFIIRLYKYHVDDSLPLESILSASVSQGQSSGHCKQARGLITEYKETHQFQDGKWVCNRSSKPEALEKKSRSKLRNKAGWNRLSRYNLSLCWKQGWVRLHWPA